MHLYVELASLVNYLEIRFSECLVLPSGLSFTDFPSRQAGFEMQSIVRSATPPSFRFVFSSSQSLKKAIY
jgi:hypothetical protein